MTESDERQLAEIRAQDAAYIRKHGHTFSLADFGASAGRNELLTMLDEARAENVAASAEINALWRKTQPELNAQKIRAQLSLDIAVSVSDSLPEYVWDLVDVAAQRGIAAENARILGLLRDPPEDVVEALRVAIQSKMSGARYIADTARDGARAALSTLAGKIAEGQPAPLPDQIPIVNPKPD